MNRITLPTAEIMSRGSQRYFSGYGAVFYNPDDKGTEFELPISQAAQWQRMFSRTGKPLTPVERIVEGAFNLSQSLPIQLRYNHSPEFVLGDSQHELSLELRQRGLYYEHPIHQKPAHQLVESYYDDGTVKGSSFEFFVIRATRSIEGDKEVFWVREAQIVDVAMVNNPAYSSAETATMRRSVDVATCDYYQRLRDEAQLRDSVKSLRQPHR